MNWFLKKKKRSNTSQSFERLVKYWMQPELFEFVWEKENYNNAQVKVAILEDVDWRPLQPPAGVDRGAAIPKLFPVFDIPPAGFLLPD